MNERFLNRDISLLAFNRRVLEQAQDPSAPLLERVRFLAILASNLDEFFMKRAARLNAHPETLALCRAQVLEILEAKARLWEGEILPKLAAEGVQLLRWADLSKGEQKRASEYFQAEVFPVLTPLAVDPSHPFPFLSNLSLSLGVRLRKSEGGKALFARIKIPDVLPQWLRLSGREGEALRLLRLEELVESHLPAFFPEMLVDSVSAFRATRNADVGHSPEEVEDVLDVVEEELRLRRVSDLVRIQYAPTADPQTLAMLRAELALPESAFYATPGELNDSALFEVFALNRPDLKYRPFSHRPPKGLRDQAKSVFKSMREGDVLLHFPFDSFESSVQRLLSEAATDKKVLAIKIALYRLGDHSPLIPLLIRAAEAGKQVVCVVELKARFDEARNISISETLEKAGVHVVYGIVGLKTHCKLALVVRREPKGLRFYGHIGTGNYNPTTAKSYTDFGLLTADPLVTADMLEVFNYLTGLSQRREYRKFLLAPVNMKPKLLELIHAERDNARQGLPSGIVAKMNSLEDPEVCEALYEASGAGVKVSLMVRGICCLKPGEPGLSENISVHSVVGRFLEHSRAYYFRAGAKKALSGHFYIGSSDWMHRNLAERVEAAAPVEDHGLRERLWEILNLYLDDKAQSWKLLPDGRYEKLAAEGAPGVQDALLELSASRGGK